MTRRSKDVGIGCRRHINDVTTFGFDVYTTSGYRYFLYATLRSNAIHKINCNTALQNIARARGLCIDRIRKDIGFVRNITTCVVIKDVIPHIINYTAILISRI